ncbi:Hint domain-containing protein [Candidatus Albibeggiatoa sp. nov. BB20]|uniref:Hint domain-containing protein n=1 Tax=Candidatus Albibeggiatoa sp. nov. BB20 TaxID=3162723 RepID=UPI003365A6B1
MNFPNQFLSETTAGHPFYIQGKGWQPASSLKVGEALQLHNSVVVVIKTIDTSVRFEKVYNLTVANTHNYFVGDDGVLVHNAKCKVWYDKNGRKQIDIVFPTRKQAKDAAQKRGLWSNKPEKHKKGHRHFHDKNHGDKSKPNYHYSFPD